MPDEYFSSRLKTPLQRNAEKPPAPAPPGHASTAGAGHAVKHRARRQFDAWAHSFDRSIVQHLLWRPAYRMLMEELYRWRRDLDDPFDLLDIGSGTGTWTAMTAGGPLRAARIVGLDYSIRMCGVAHGKAKQIDEGAPVFVNADAEHLPFADESFDVLTCSHSLHHYPHQAATVRETYRVLRPGGRLMVVDGFRDNAIGWVLYDVFVTKAESTPEAKVHHPSWRTLRQYFADAGFRDVRQRKANIWAPIFLTIGAV